MIRQPFLWILTSVLTLAPLTARAEPMTLGSFELFPDVVFVVPETEPGRFSLNMPGVELFHSHVLTQEEGTRSFVADASTEADFAAFAALATNGRADPIQFRFGPASGGFEAFPSDSEGALFNLPPGVVDFNGFRLSGVVLEVTQYANRPALGDSNLFLLSLRGSVSVLGEPIDVAATPEPASMTLLAAGGLALLSMRRRRRAS